MYYSKPALTFEQQVTLLQARGLHIEDRALAEETLSHISYFRLSAYFRPFRVPNSEQFAGASFANVLNMYKFDKSLRLIVSDFLEVIEVHFRTRITYHLASRGGAFAHVDPVYFVPSFNHVKFLADIKELEAKSSDKFVKHFQTKYAEENQLPVWMATELMSFGFISRLYSELTTDLQKEIAADLEVHQSVLRTWLHTLSYVRNVCAHHGRLWNRELAITPRIPNGADRWKYLGVDPKRCYGMIVLLCDILSRIGEGDRCRDTFAGLFASCDRMQLAGMRVPANWKLFAPWVTA